MEGQKSAAYKKAEGMMTAVLLLVFIVWTPVYLFWVRPKMNLFLANYISGYPAMLHLVPILAPVVIIALVASKFLPAKGA